MERGYPGGFFLAVDVAQQVILMMRASSAVNHLLIYEMGMNNAPLGKSGPLISCTEAPRRQCFVLHVGKDAATVPRAAGTGDTENVIPSRLARDVARFLVLYVKKRPYLVHGFFAHECRAIGSEKKWLQPKCGMCTWIPRESNRCSYCKVTHCTVCVSEESYKPCGQGCCRLCHWCYPTIMNETCDVAGCTGLQCTNQAPMYCETGRCWNRFCVKHAKLGEHPCDEKRKKDEQLK